MLINEIIDRKIMGSNFMNLPLNCSSASFIIFTQLDAFLMEYEQYQPLALGRSIFVIITI